MTNALDYVVVTAFSMRATSATVVGLPPDEVPPLQLIKSLNELRYKVIFFTNLGDCGITWTLVKDFMMANCTHTSQNSSMCQTLDELDFERGIWFAAQYNDIPRVKGLIEKGKSVNLEDKSGYTALHYASRNGHLEMCELLISKGANVNALTRSGKVSPLHRCASTGNFEIFKLLLHSGASINVKDSDGKTVLHRAVEGGNAQIVQEILKIDPKLAKEADNRGSIPKQYVKNAQDITDILNKYC